MLEESAYRADLVDRFGNVKSLGLDLPGSVAIMQVDDTDAVSATRRATSQVRRFFTLKPEDGLSLDDATLMMAPPGLPPPATAATAAAPPLEKPLNQEQWVEAFPLDNPPSEEWASAITQSSSVPDWLPTMVANYATLRHLWYQCAYVPSGCQEEELLSMGVSEIEHIKALKEWVSALEGVPGALLPTPAATPTPVAAAPAGWPHPTSPKEVHWPLHMIQLQTPKHPLTDGEYTIASTQVLVRHGPFHTKGSKKAILFIAGSCGYSTKFTQYMSKGEEWPVAWEQWNDCILIAVPQTGGTQAGNGNHAPAWRAAMPLYLEEVVAWLQQLGIWFYLVCFSRGAAWGAELLRRCPNHIVGALLCAGYHTDQNKHEQVEAARALLRSNVPVIIVHSLQDEFSNPDKNPEYWNLLLRAQLGQGPNDRNANLVVQTIKVGGHEQLIPYCEGIGMMRNQLMKTSFVQCHSYLLTELAAKVGAVETGWNTNRACLNHMLPAGTVGATLF